MSRMYENEEVDVQPAVTSISETRQFVCALTTPDPVALLFRLTQRFGLKLPEAPVVPVAPVAPAGP